MKVPGLKPVAAPVDIYHRPAQAPINNDLENLAAGLSSMNAALSRFAGRQKKDERHIDEDGLAARYAGKAPEEIRAALGTDPELQNKFAAKFVGNIASQKQGDADVLYLDNWYNTDADKNGDIGKQYDEVVAKRVAENFQGNTAGAELYMRRMAAGKMALMERHNRFKTEQSGYLSQQATQDGFASIARQAIDEGSSPQKVMAETASFMQTNKAVMGKSFKEQQQYLLSAVDPLLNDMEQSPDKRDKIYAAVDAIFTQPRKGEDGVERRLIDAPDGLGDMAKKKLVEFQRKRDELNDKHLVSETAKLRYNAENNPQSLTPEFIQEWDKLHPGALKTGEVQGLLVAREKALDKAAAEQLEYEAGRKADAAKGDVDAKNYERFKAGEAFNVRDADVPTKEFYTKRDTSATKKYSADEQRQRMTDLSEQDIEYAKNQAINAKKMTPDQAEEWANGQRLDRYSSNGMVPTGWKDEMKAGVNTLISATQTATKEMPPAAVAAYRRYKLLASKAPNLLSQVADERGRAIFDAAMVADGNETQQLQGAIQYYANHTEETEKVARKKVAEAVVKMAGDPDGWGTWAKSWFGPEVPDNLGVLNEEIQKRAAYNMQAYRMTPEQALKKAGESTKGYFAIVNGRAILTNDKRLPPNFEKLSEKYIENVVLKAGQNEVGEFKTAAEKRTAGLAKLGIESHRDITLLPLKGGEFQLFDKRNGRPVLEALPVDWKGEAKDGRFLTVDMLADLAGFERAEEEERALQVGAEDRERRAIAAREAAALQKAHKHMGTDQAVGKPFIRLRGTRTPPAPWLDLSRQ